MSRTHPTSTVRSRRPVVVAILSTFALIVLPVGLSGALTIGEFGGFVALLMFVILTAAVAGFISYDDATSEQARQRKIEHVEERAREHPEKPQLAWDLARTRLENYLDRNLAQVRYIFWLTLFVMLSGFGFILFGIHQAFDEPEKLPVSIVSAASGVIISFIGGSFLLIYRSTLAQSKEYVVVLERINAVGMAVQVIANIPDDQAQLRHQTTADLAKQLLTLYGVK